MNKLFAQIAVWKGLFITIALQHKKRIIQNCANRSARQADIHDVCRRRNAGCLLCLCIGLVMNIFTTQSFFFKEPSTTCAREKSVNVDVATKRQGCGIMTKWYL